MARAVAVTPVSGDFLIQLAIAAAGLVAAYVIFQKGKAAVGDAADRLANLPGNLWEAVKDYGADLADSAATTAAELGAAVAAPVRAVVDPIRAAAPGAGLPTGWYTVKTWQGNIVTQFPDRYKSLNRWDSVLVDP